MTTKHAVGQFFCHYCEELQRGRRTSVREMMLGTGDEFDYLECEVCGSLQRDTFSNELRIGEYYPEEYYSMSSRGGLYGAIKSRLYYHLDMNTVIQGDRIGSFLSKVYRQNGAMGMIGRLGLDRSSAILDVGCGDAAHLLDRLSKIGFTNLKGVDPYLSKSEVQRGDIKLEKRDLMGLGGFYRLIMFNHSLEHVESPNEVLKKAVSLLEPDGNILVRIPIMDSYASRRYGANWVQLDAPRHVSIPTRSGFRALAARCGLKVEREIDDSSAFQFIASEKYENDVPLTASGGVASLLNAGRIPFLTFFARRLNEARLGDQTCFLLSRPRDTL